MDAFFVSKAIRDYPILHRPDGRLIFARLAGTLHERSPTVLDDRLLSQCRAHGESSPATGLHYQQWGCGQWVSTSMYRQSGVKSFFMEVLENFAKLCPELCKVGTFLDTASWGSVQLASRSVVESLEEFRNDWEWMGRQWVSYGRPSPEPEVKVVMTPPALANEILSRRQLPCFVWDALCSQEWSSLRRRGPKCGWTDEVHPSMAKCAEELRDFCIARWEDEAWSAERLLVEIRMRLRRCQRPEFQVSCARCCDAHPESEWLRLHSLRRH